MNRKILITMTALLSFSVFSNAYANPTIIYRHNLDDKYDGGTENPDQEIEKAELGEIIMTGDNFYVDDQSSLEFSLSSNTADQWKATGLPNGLSMNSDGTLSGSVSSSGNFTIFVTAYNSTLKKTSAKSMTFSVLSLPTLTNDLDLGQLLAGDTIPKIPLTFAGGSGEPYRAEITQVNGSTNTQYEYRLNSPRLGSYELILTPTTLGDKIVDVKITDSKNKSNLVTFTSSQFVGWQFRNPTYGQKVFTLSNMDLKDAKFGINDSRFDPAKWEILYGTPENFVFNAPTLPSNVSWTQEGFMSGNNIPGGTDIPFDLTITKDGRSHVSSGHRLISYDPLVSENIDFGYAILNPNGMYQVSALTSNTRVHPEINLTTDASEKHPELKIYPTIKKNGNNSSLTATISSGTGKPELLKPYSFNVTATDRISKETTTFPAVVTIAPRLYVATQTPPDAQVGVDYAYKVIPEGGLPLDGIGGNKFKWSIASSSTLKGISIDEDGNLSGKPLAAGNFYLTINLEDALGQTTDKRFTVKVLDSSKINMAFAPVLSAELNTDIDSEIQYVGSGKTAMPMNIAGENFSYRICSTAENCTAAWKGPFTSEQTDTINSVQHLQLRQRTGSDLVKKTTVSVNIDGTPVQWDVTTRDINKPIFSKFDPWSHSFIDFDQAVITQPVQLTGFDPADRDKFKFSINLQNSNVPSQISMSSITGYYIVCNDQASCSNVAANDSRWKSMPSHDLNINLNDWLTVKYIMPKSAINSYGSNYPNNIPALQGQGYGEFKVSLNYTYEGKINTLDSVRFAMRTYQAGYLFTVGGPDTPYNFPVQNGEYPYRDGFYFVGKPTPYYGKDPNQFTNLKALTDSTGAQYGTLYYKVCKTQSECLSNPTTANGWKLADGGKFVIDDGEMYNLGIEFKDFTTMHKTFLLSDDKSSYALIVLEKN